MQRTQVLVAQRGGDQQHRVGSVNRRLVELVGVDDEVLADDRQIAGGARGAQVGQRASEVWFVGQHREGSRSATLVGGDVGGNATRPGGTNNEQTGTQSHDAKKGGSGQGGAR